MIDSQFGQAMGMTNKLSQLGYDDPKKYLGRFPALALNPAGGYRIRATPHELSGLIAGIKAKTNGASIARCLSVGSLTLGAERAICENTGVQRLEVFGSSGIGYLANLKALDISVAKTVQRPDGKYDLILIANDYEMGELLNYCHAGTLIVCLGIGNGGEAKNTWGKFRAKYRANILMQSVGMPFETGIGLLEVSWVEPDVTVKTMQEFKEEVKAPYEPFLIHGTMQAINDPREPLVPKRKGRPPLNRSLEQGIKPEVMRGAVALQTSEG